MTHHIKLPFCMPYFFSRKIILHQFHVDKNEGDSGIGYKTIIGGNLIVKLGLVDDLNIKSLQQYCAAVPMKEPSSLLGQTYLTSRDISKVVTKYK